MSLMFKAFSPNQSSPLSSWDDLSVFSLFVSWLYLVVRPLRQFTPTGAWAISTYDWYKSKMKLVIDHKWYVWFFQWVASSSRQVF